MGGEGGEGQGGLRASLTFSRITKDRSGQEELGNGTGGRCHKTKSQPGNATTLFGAWEQYLFCVLGVQMWIGEVVFFPFFGRVSLRFLFQNGILKNESR